MLKTLRPIAALLLILLLLPAPQALAVSKEMIQLQTQVQQLQDSLNQMKQADDERMGVLRHLVEQTADSVNRMSASVDTMQRSIQAQHDAQSAKSDQISSQVQGVNDSIDELKSRMARLEKALQDLQATQQNVTTQQATNTQPANPADAGQPAATQPPPAPPLDQLYQGGIRDYNSAKYDLAAQEFSDVIKYYPQEDRAGNAQFYIAEISYRQGDYANAIKGYNALFEQYPGNIKVPAAQLHKGMSYIQLKQRDAGIREFRSLLQRYPQTPEALQARSQLNAMGATIAPKPSAARPRQ